MTRSGRFRFIVVAPLLIFLGTAVVSAQPAAAQSGADLAASISGDRTVRFGDNISYAITATNVGDLTATAVELLPDIDAMVVAVVA